MGCPNRVERREINMRRLLWFSVAFSFVVAAATARAEGPPGKSDSAAAASIVKKLGRGMNFGNALEAPNEGEWGVTLKADYFRAIKEAGFDTIRLPVRWSAHAQADAPYTIDPVFAKRIDWAIDQAVANKLNII